VGGFCLQFRKGEEFFAQILERGADVVCRVVNEQEAVVKFVRLREVDGVVLRVVFCQVELELAGDFSGDDFRVNPGGSFREQEQDGFVHVVVEQDEGFFRGFHEVGGKDVGVEYLPFVKDALHGRERGAHEEINFLFGLGDAVLDALESLVDGMAAQEIVFEDAVRPLAEEGGVAGVNPVADR